MAARSAALRSDPARGSLLPIARVCQSPLAGIALRLLRRSRGARRAELDRNPGGRAEKQAHKRPSEALRGGPECDWTPRFGRLRSPKAPERPVFPGSRGENLRTIDYARLRNLPNPAHDSSPLLLTDAPHFCSRPARSGENRWPSVGIAGGRPWGEPMAARGEIRWPLVGRTDGRRQ